MGQAPMPCAQFASWGKNRPDSASKECSLACYTLLLPTATGISIFSRNHRLAGLQKLEVTKYQLIRLISSIDRE